MSIDAEDPFGEGWDYPGFALSFAADCDWRLVSFEVWDEQAGLSGVRVFGRPFLEVLTDLAEVGFVSPEVHGPEEDGEVHLSFPSHYLELWRDEAQFTSLAAGVAFGEDDVELWPT